MTNTKRARWALPLTLALIASLLVALPAAAEEDEADVDTNATIGGGDGSPDIICKWELPDFDGDGRNNNPFIQYGDDDDPANDANNPCRGVDPNTEYVQDDDARSVIQVRANPEDEPTERVIELWMAVRGDANVGNVDSVFWDVFHPDRTFKVQEHGTKFDGDPAGDLGATFNQGAGYYSIANGSMWDAAVFDTGQIAVDTARSQQGLIARAKQNSLQLWWGQFELSKHQPCGEYTIEAYATYQGNTSMIRNSIDVLCYVNLETDFSSVSWDEITPGGTDWVYGDLQFDEGGESPFPTVKNTASGGMVVGLEFTEMVRPNDPDVNTTKVIDKFDAMFGINPDFLEVRDPIFAGDEVDFGTGYHQVLCANETGKLDLSIHPPIGLPAGDYEGNLTVFGEWIGNDEGSESPCLNDAGIWRPPFKRFPPDAQNDS